jgi:hypothetical protein
LKNIVRAIYLWFIGPPKTRKDPKSRKRPKDVKAFRESFTVHSDMDTKPFLVVLLVWPLNFPSV